MAMTKDRDILRLALELAIAADEDDDRSSKTVQLNVRIDRQLKRKLNMKAFIERKTLAEMVEGWIDSM